MSATGDRRAATWQDLDQEALDAAYDQARWAPDMHETLATLRAASAAARARLGEPLALAYGPGAIERIELHGAASVGAGAAAASPGTAAPLLVFVHGGAWRSGRAEDYAFLAEPFVRAGARVAIPDFDSVLDTGGDLRPQAAQVRRAIGWLQREAPRLGLDPERVVLCGHSSGAHLAAAALVHAGDPGDDEPPLAPPRAAVLASGMYDLAPVRRSSRNRYVAFDDAVEHALSPQRHLERLRTPIVVAWGTRESPEFVRQSRDFVAALEGRGHPVRAIAVERDHFRILEELGGEDGVLARAVLDLLGTPRI